MVVVAEKIVPTATLAELPELTVIPEVLVDSVVHVPGGALPTGCHPLYGVDEAHVWRYLEAASTEAGLQAYLEETASCDRAGAGHTS